ncbi:Fungal N-terminal domain-containing protein [Madurella fahalii]|uniref:Fungal N-terminal domain-containing protein n=1 Tax=Madurella fahalii TaxID=1157608 RepID=A0ABQ0GER5_9PEZI
MSAESNELLEAFKAAALSVTKLYKTSASAQAKSRADGYQDCLEDLLTFLDKENIGLANGEGQKIRKWVTERLEGRDTTSPSLESDDEAEKAEVPVSSPQVPRSATTTTLHSGDKCEVQMRDSAPPILATIPCPSSPAVEEVDIVVPSQETFTFQSSQPYPQDAAMRLANLDLSDSQQHGSTNRSTPRCGRSRNARAGPRASLGRGAGQKRKVNLAEIFDLGSLDYGNGKDMFGSGGKRSRHV